MLTLPPIVKGSEARSGAQGGKGSGTTPTKGNSHHRGPASLGARGAEAGGRTTHRAARRRGGGPVLNSPPTEVESERRLPRTERVALHVDPLRDVCTSLLRDGHVGAFTELFRAVRERRAARLAADPGSTLALEPPLEQHPRELHDLAALLSRAEDAARAGDADAQCQTLLSLAERFRGSGVAPWLEGRALRLCLEASREAGGGPREAEALARLGEARHGHGDLEGALPVLRDYHALVRAQGWRDASGREHEARSSTLLSRLLTELGRRALDRGEAHESLGPLQEALSLARHGQESRAQQEASYWLGLALLDTGDTDSALQRLLAAEELSVALQDAAARARATRSVAEALLRLGRVSEAQRSLERLLEATRQSGGQEEELLDASCRLADIHLAKGSARTACRLLDAALERARAGPAEGASSSSVPRGLSESLLTEVRARCGVARAALLFPALAADLALPGLARAGPASGPASGPARGALERLLAWKDSRRGYSLEAELGAEGDDDKEEEESDDGSESPRGDVGPSGAQGVGGAVTSA
ncbi:tetratricopeptide repeat protein 29-like isoform X1 [Lethenteron reissneri]|uniref:tetratricopeptide repeat protein 29-like isoform X1 n=1 Tax=Lethenteron reissneri TaxID=7753 RepID=UPI002AB6DFF3|nr:tetratricopeptide repeat protein 29-like isoform X1 [Lethenteron reissneri]